MLTPKISDELRNLDQMSIPNPNFLNRSKIIMRLHQFFMFLLLGFIFNYAFADETQLRKMIQAHFPGSEIESLRKTPYMSLYEVVIGGEIIYTDEKAEYFFRRTYSRY